MVDRDRRALASVRDREEPPRLRRERDARRQQDDVDVEGRVALEGDAEGHRDRGPIDGDGVARLRAARDAPADLDGRHSSEETTRCHFLTEMSVGLVAPFLTWVPPLG